MQLMDEHVRIIERDSEDISSLWRIFQIIFYFVGAIAGYLGTIFFYTFWQDIFHGQCPFWANAAALSHKEPSPMENFSEEEHTYTDQRLNITNWGLQVSVSHVYNAYCNTYLIVMLCSSAFGIIWLTFFYLCGKGGYDGQIFEAPWRVVTVAFFFNVIFSVIVFYTAHSICEGFAAFSTELGKLYSRLTSTDMLRLYDEKCSVMQTYVDAYKGNKYNVCRTLMYIKVLVWLMSASWIGGTILLFFRILTVTDFAVLKITVCRTVSHEDSSPTTDGEEEQKNK